MELMCLTTKALLVLLDMCLLKLHSLSGIIIILNALLTILRIISNLLSVFWGITRDITFKEKHEINKGVLNSEKKRVMFKLTWKEKVANISEFMNQDQIESQVQGVV